MLTFPLLSLLLTVWVFGFALGLAYYALSRHKPTAAFLMVWTALAWGLSLNGYFQEPLAWSQDDNLGMFFLLISAGLLPFFHLFGLRRPPDYQRFTANLPVYWLTGLHVVRLSGLAVWWVSQEGGLPAAIGLYAGVTSVFFGGSALLLAAYTLKVGTKATRWLQVWHRLGLLDVLGWFLLLVLAYWGVLAFQPAPSLLGLHPLALITLVQMPLAGVAHALALKSL